MKNHKLGIGRIGGGRNGGPILKEMDAPAKPPDSTHIINCNDILDTTAEIQSTT